MLRHIGLVFTTASIQELNELLQHSPPADATPEEREDYRKSVAAKQEEIAALTKLLSNP